MSAISAIGPMNWSTWMRKSRLRRAFLTSVVLARWTICCPPTESQTLIWDWLSRSCLMMLSEWAVRAAPMRNSLPPTMPLRISSVMGISK